MAGVLVTLFLSCEEAFLSWKAQLARLRPLSPDPSQLGKDGAQEEQHDSSPHQATGLAWGKVPLHRRKGGVVI